MTSSLSEINRAASSEADDPMPIPILLLKTKSTPNDSYEDLFSSSQTCTTHGRSFEPRFLSVLSHTIHDDGVNRLDGLLKSRKIGYRDGCDYGGLVFTSQRAVEAFARVVERGKDGSDPSWPFLQDIPIYSVGPATTRALKAVPQQPALQVFGDHTGNGEALAEFILEHYARWYPNASSKPPLLFLVGETRRDIIPRILMSLALPADRRIRVDEEVVYSTGVREPFSADFDVWLRETQSSPSRWVVVFSPTGCDSMLRGLGRLDAITGQVDEQGADGRTFIATIGPTTKSYLIETFGCPPDVSAKSPSPEGVLQAVMGYDMNNEVKR
ncbi:hypothetical protein RJ55_01908 [Drechmeria coniospora]|nr:hypothetical protein RJ55_01908 [Drechmeria coniospora]